MVKDKMTLKEAIAEVLKSLSPWEQRVITLRFGLVEDRRSRTLEGVAAEFYVSRERIRQIEARALRKLRHPRNSRYLKDFNYATIDTPEHKLLKAIFG